MTDKPDNPPENYLTEDRLLKHAIRMGHTNEAERIIRMQQARRQEKPDGE